MSSLDENLPDHPVPIPVRPLVYQPEQWWNRLLLISGGVVCLSLLIVTRMLAPDPDGIGTHQQLGLPPCGFIVVWDMPCPSCGMTTSWAWLTRGHLVNSLRANPGGTMLGIGSLVFGFWMLISGIRGRWFWRAPNSVWLASLTVAAFLVTGIHWAFQLWK